MAHINWKNYLQDEIKKEYYKNILHTLENEIKNGKIIYPPKDKWFNVLNMNPENIKVVIIGQDPYHGPNQAQGYSFSVERGVKIPPSLKNIYTEIENEFKIKMSSSNGDLTPWVKQGVFLLNAILTVEKSNPASHKALGWEKFTDNLIKIISENCNNVVFLLWGKFAENKKFLINNQKHLVLTSAHPSPYSVQNFFGNNHFIQTNEYLIKHGKEPIDWKIVD